MTTPEPTRPTALKTATDVAFCGAWTTFCFFLASAGLPFARQGRASHWLVRNVWARLMLRYYGVETTVSGLERLDPQRPYLYVSNHMSHFDVLAIFVTNPGNLRFVAKKELFYIPFFGPYLWAAGHIPIDRSNREKAIASLERAAARMRGGVPVVTFPEGSRSADGQVHDFKKGPFMLAIKAGVPVVPVTITGSDKVLPKKALSARPGRIHVHYGEPIEVASYTVDDRDRLMGEVRRQISSTKAELERRAGEGEAEPRSEATCGSI